MRWGDPSPGRTSKYLIRIPQSTCPHRRTDSILHQEMRRNATLTPELGKEEEGQAKGVRTLSHLTGVRGLKE